MKARLTARRLQILREIAEDPQATRRELCERLGLSSIATLQTQLETLAGMGLLEWDTNSPRSLRLTAEGIRALGMTPEELVLQRLLREIPDVSPEMLLQAVLKTAKGGG